MQLFVMLEKILGSYQTDPKVKMLFENLDFYITPVLNMDGYIYSWKDNTVSFILLSTSIRHAFNEGKISAYV